MQTKFHLFWKDPRITLPSDLPASYNGTLVLGAEFAKKIWIPDISIPMCVSESKMGILGDNAVVEIREGGLMYYNSEINLVIRCNLQYQTFPFDEQNCIVVMESCEYF